MRTAITLYLTKAGWELGAGPDGHGAKNGVPVDTQRNAFFNPSGWPKDVTACIFVNNEGEYRHADRKLSETIMEQTAAASKRADEKLELQKKRSAEAQEKRDADRKKDVEANAGARALEVKAKEERKKAVHNTVIPQPKK